MDGDRKDTLLIIAVKINNAKLVDWMLSLDGLDTTKQNGKGMNAMAVAKALGREHLLLGIASSHAPSDTTQSGGKGATGAASAATGCDDPPPPPNKAADDEAGLEIARLGNALKMLKVMGTTSGRCDTVFNTIFTEMIIFGFAFCLRKQGAEHGSGKLHFNS